MNATKINAKSPESFTTIAPVGSIPVPDGAAYLPDFACWVFERNEQLWSTHIDPDFPGVWFTANEGCVDDLGACDSDWLAAANAALGTDYADAIDHEQQRANAARCASCEAAVAH